jgi:DNA-binding transcriptional LysR family regulator
VSGSEPLNLKQVKAFLAVVEAGGFRGAAAALGCAQPTVSQLLQKLEEGLGAALVLRSHAGCRPTPAGSFFLPFARALLNTEERARASVFGGPFTAGASSNIGIYLLPPHLPRLDRACGRQIEMRIGSNPDIAAKLEAAQIDVALLEWWDNRRGFVALEWRREPLVAIVPPDHVWARRESITLAELLAGEVLGGEAGSGTRTLLRQVCGTCAEALHGRALGSTEAVKQAVKAGLGVSLILAGTVVEEVSRGSLVALPVADVRLEKILYIVLPAEAPETAPARGFARALLAAKASEGHQFITQPPVQVG